MRPLLFTAAVLLVPAIAAQADTFQVTFTPGGVPFDPNHAVSFQLNLPSAPTLSDNLSFTFQAVPVVLGGTPVDTDIAFASYTPSGSSTPLYQFAVGDGIGIGENSVGVVTYPPPAGDTPGYSALYAFLSTEQPLFTGPLTDPTLLPGTYGNSPNPNPPDLLTITDLSTGTTAVTPEPSTFALFGTGLLGLTGVVKRRLAR